MAEIDTLLIHQGRAGAALGPAQRPGGARRLPLGALGGAELRVCCSSCRREKEQRLSGACAKGEEATRQAGAPIGAWPGGKARYSERRREQLPCLQAARLAGDAQGSARFIRDTRRSSLPGNFLHVAVNKDAAFLADVIDPRQQRKGKSKGDGAQGLLNRSASVLWRHASS